MNGSWVFFLLEFTQKRTLPLDLTLWDGQPNTVIKIIPHFVESLTLCRESVCFVESLPLFTGTPLSLPCGSQARIIFHDVAGEDCRWTVDTVSETCPVSSWQPLRDGLLTSFFPSPPVPFWHLNTNVRWHIDFSLLPSPKHTKSQLSKYFSGPGYYVNGNFVQICPKRYESGIDGKILGTKLRTWGSKKP